MKAVQVHSSRVSMNTDSICTRPCLTGWLTSAQAAALGALPQPASLEYRPRLMPYIMQEEAKPPKMAWKSKASWKMRPNTWGSRVMWVRVTISDTSTYTMPITGTSREVTFTTRLPPPSRQ